MTSLVTKWSMLDKEIDEMGESLFAFIDLKEYDSLRERIIRIKKLSYLCKKHRKRSK